MKKALLFSFLIFLPISHISAQSWSEYVPAWCTINRTLLQGAQVLSNQMVLMAATAGNPEAIDRLQELYAQRSPAELMCEVEAVTLSGFANELVLKVIEMDPTVSSATKSALYSIAAKALKAVSDRYTR